ncbi:MAG: hypothetical protein U0841_05620 [Chloroflexia bacterium]
MYLAWFDANPKKPTAQKIAEAHQRYVEKFGRKPRVCLVNPEDAIAESAVELRPLTHISRNCFWIGVDDAEEAAQESTTTTPARAPRKPKAGPTIPDIVPAIAAAPDAPTTAARTRKPKAAPAIEPIVAAASPVADTAQRSRKPKAAPVAPPAPVVIPEPTIVPEPKRRTRREKAAA